jgi:hypothetical protein
VEAGDKHLNSIKVTPKDVQSLGFISSALYFLFIFPNEVESDVIQSAASGK